MKNARQWLVVFLTATCALVMMFFMFLLFQVEHGRIEKARAEECRVLAAIGVKAGDNITIYGDMPTWKIACLMGDGDN